MEKLSIIIGKCVQKISRLRGGGSAFPGLVVEKINPRFINQILSKLPYGVVVISGTNGKTTTTKIVTELLEGQNLKVFTNKSGSNFVRGVISEILNNITISGRFDYDIAVLELDEAHAVKFSEVAPIDYALFLNVQRDQLDRFGEIDYTAELLQKVASHAKRAIVLNREDPRVSKITAQKGAQTYYFGLSDDLVDEFPSDDQLINSGKAAVQNSPEAKVILSKLEGQTATFEMDTKSYECDLTLKGIYNAYNAAGALALVKTVLPEAGDQTFIQTLSNIESAFGRGEQLIYEGSEMEILLVKNPSAFQLSIASFADEDHDFMIAINDRSADGQDVSWLWNVDFSAFKNVTVVSGSRATDMALRLKYDEVKVENCEEDLEQALKTLAASGDKPKRVFTTYTAMLEIRKIISGSSIL